MRVAVGGICHPRLTLEPWRRALEKLDPGPCTLVPCFVGDGLSDKVDVTLNWHPSQHYTREAADHLTLRRIYERLAFLRNTLAQLALSLDCEALFSVDSDIVVPPETFLKLHLTEHPWVAAIVRNSATNRNCWNVFHYRPKEGFCQHFQAAGVGADGVSWPGKRLWTHDPNDPQKVEDLAAGAVCLYRRDILLKARWHSTGRGVQEDLGFAQDAFEAGFTAGYVPIKCAHLTVDGIDA